MWNLESLKILLLPNERFIKIPILALDHKNGDQDKEGPFCASCSETLIHLDENGEFVVREEYRGKITYQDGDFSEEDPREHLVVGIVVSEEEGKQEH